VTKAGNSEMEKPIAIRPTSETVRCTAIHHSFSHSHSYSHTLWLNHSRSCSRSSNHSHTMHNHSHNRSHRRPVAINHLFPASRLGSCSHDGPDAGGTGGYTHVTLVTPCCLLCMDTGFGAKQRSSHFHTHSSYMSSPHHHHHTHNTHSPPSPPCVPPTGDVPVLCPVDPLPPRPAAAPQPVDKRGALGVQVPHTLHPQQVRTPHGEQGPTSEGST